MKFTKYPTEFWKKVQINAGILVTGFNPSGAYTGLLGATSNGVTFNPNPTYEDFGADIDNVPPNAWQLKRLKSYDPSLSGTFRTVDLALAAQLCPGDVLYYSLSPRAALTDEDFRDVTLIGDYSDVNDDYLDDNANHTAGMIAVTIHSALNINGFQWKTNKDGKGEFSFDFHGHYDLNVPDLVPFTIYVQEGTTTEMNPPIDFPIGGDSGGGSSGGK